MMCLFNNLHKIILIGSLLMPIAGQVYAYKIKINDPKDKDKVSGIISIQTHIIVNSCDKNKSYSEVDKILRNMEKDIAKIFNDIKAEKALDLVKALLQHESGWVQFNEDGTLYTGINKKTKDIGISQINDTNSSLDQKWDIDKIQTDEEYNIKAGIQILNNKKNGIDVLKKDKNNWTRIIAKRHLKGHTDSEIILRAYNGWGKKIKADGSFPDNWSYPNTIKKIADKKPWETQVAVRILVDSRVIAQNTIRLIDLFSCAWDTVKEKTGTHRITAEAKKSNHQINVMVDNQEKKEVIWGRMSGTTTHEMNGIIADFSISINEIKFKTPEDRLDDEKASMLATFNPKTEKQKKEMIKTIDSLQREKRQYLKDYKPKQTFFTGKGIVEFRLKQISTERGVMRFNNPYILETAIDGCIDQEKAEELKGRDPFANLPPEIRAKLPPARGLQGGPVQNSSIKGEMNVEIGLEGRKDGKDIKYYSRQKFGAEAVFVGGKIDRKEESKIPEKELLSTEEIEGYFSIGNIISGISFVGNTSKKDKNKLILATDISYPATFLSRTGTISIKANGYLKTKK